ncbi:unnamed protein product [Prorocentrum cordatum]|uniref:Uncharacterized protein n=1 Tax=Prorocentrum cordatum TaxID=2364126 RepID=A0ABN9VMY2_9DINO|nr:unnamed protein product [Polarella glacialis]
MPAAASVMALSGCIGGSLRKRLSAVRNELEQGDSEAARHAYAEYVKYLREAKAIASPVIVFLVLWVGVLHLSKCMTLLEFTCKKESKSECGVFSEYSSFFG